MFSQPSCQRLLLALLCNMSDFRSEQGGGSGWNCSIEFARLNRGCLDESELGQIHAMLDDISMRRRGKGGEILCREEVVSLWL